MAGKTARLGAYQLLARLNAGGTAEVYLAGEPRPGGRPRLVAIKRILPELVGEGEFTKMLIDEARLVSQLVHPGIARVLDLGREQGELFLALEYVAGKDVAALAKRARMLGRPLDVALACHIVAEVLDALGYAHEARDASGRPLQIVHRDVSPSNILIAWTGEVKLIDFGIARASNRLTKTQAGVLKGKFRYMSPEQASGLPLDGRADVYAAAVVLHELLSGEKLFSGDSGFSLIEKVIAGKVPSLRGRAGISDELAEHVDRGLVSVPDHRWASAAEFAKALREHLGRTARGRDLKAELGAWMQESFAPEFREERTSSARLLETLVDFEAQEAEGATVLERSVPDEVRAALSRTLEEPKTIMNVPTPMPARPPPRPLELSISDEPPPQRERPRGGAGGGKGILVGVLGGLLLAGIGAVTFFSRSEAPPLPVQAEVVAAPEPAPAPEVVVVAPPPAPEVVVVSPPPAPKPEPTPSAPKAPPPPPPPAPKAKVAPAKLQIVAMPPGRVWLDGEETRHQTPVDLEVEAGPHLVWVVDEAGRKGEARVRVSAGQTEIVLVTYSN